MLRLLMISKEIKPLAELSLKLTENGFVCSIIRHDNGLVEEITTHRPDLVLVEVDDHSPGSRTWELIHSIKRERHLPTMALVAENMLDSIDGHLDLDDFLTSPHDIRELVLRINRLLNGTINTDSSELI